LLETYCQFPEGICQMRGKRWHPPAMASAFIDNKFMQQAFCMRFIYGVKYVISRQRAYFGFRPRTMARHPLYGTVA